MLLPTQLPPNSSFSPHNRLLQLAIDSTSLGEFKICPRRYQLSILLGFTPRSESVHLTFGLLLHGAIEHYHRLRAAGTAHESALVDTVWHSMCNTWDRDLNRPWSSDDHYKNRFTLIRTIVQYLDKWQNDPLETLILSNGNPAVELSFRYDSGYQTQSTGEPWLICGHFDRIASGLSGHWIVDTKSTKLVISPDWFAKFTPDNQFTIYTSAGRVAFSFDLEGVIVDGCQVLVGESRFQRGLVRRSSWQLDEWHQDLGYWLEQIEGCAISGKWPQNDKSCNLYGGCPFRSVCSAGSAASRDQLLQETYKRRVWDPLQRRGDI